jgi:hypothetical protein
MNKYFVINGQGGSGKDSFIKMVDRYYLDKVINVSSVDPIKWLAKYGDWDGGKTDKDRKFLSDLKKLFIDYNDLPLRFLTMQMKLLHEDSIIFMHVREGSEIDKMKAVEPAIKTVLIDRQVEEKGNDSDDMVYDYEYDYVIDNNGSLEDLDEAAITFVDNVVVLEEF